MICFSVTCQFCGYINSKPVPVVAKDDEMTLRCPECHKIVIMFYQEDEQNGNGD